MFKLIKYFFICFIAMLIFIAHKTEAAQDPRPIIRDARIKVVNYDANNVVNIKGHPLIVTTVEFADDESVLNISLGDALAWNAEVIPSKSSLLNIKPVILNANTDMLVVTDKRTYHFELNTLETDDRALFDATYHLQFKYPEDERRLRQKKKQQVEYAKAQLINPPDNNNADPTQWNFNYRFKGSKKIVPIQVFDDKKQFTYIKFGAKPYIPAIYAVNEIDQDVLINYRQKGPYIIIEKIAPKFRLRRGQEETTLINGDL